MVDCSSDHCLPQKFKHIWPCMEQQKTVAAFLTPLLNGSRVNMVMCECKPFGFYLEGSDLRYQTCVSHRERSACAFSFRGGREHRLEQEAAKRSTGQEWREVVGEWLAFTVYRDWELGKSEEQSKRGQSFYPNFLYPCLRPWGTHSEVFYRITEPGFLSLWVKVTTVFLRSSLSAAALFCVWQVQVERHRLLYVDLMVKTKSFRSIKTYEHLFFLMCASLCVLYCLYSKIKLMLVDW